MNKTRFRVESMERTTITRVAYVEAMDEDEAHEKATSLDNDEWDEADRQSTTAYAFEAEAEPDRDDDYERAAARARGNDFEDTDGKDWT